MEQADYQVDRKVHGRQQPRDQREGSLHYGKSYVDYPEKQARRRQDERTYGLSRIEQQIVQILQVVNHAVRHIPIKLTSNAKI